MPPRMDGATRLWTWNGRLFLVWFALIGGKQWPCVCLCVWSSSGCDLLSPSDYSHPFTHTHNTPPTHTYTHLPPHTHIHPHTHTQERLPPHPRPRLRHPQRATATARTRQRHGHAPAPAALRLRQARAAADAVWGLYRRVGGGGGGGWNKCEDRGVVPLAAG